MKWVFFAVLLISAFKSAMDIPADHPDSTLSTQICRIELSEDSCVNGPLAMELWSRSSAKDAQGRGVMPATGSMDSFGSVLANGLIRCQNRDGTSLSFFYLSG